MSTGHGWGVAIGEGMGHDWPHATLDAASVVAPFTAILGPSQPLGGRNQLGQVHLVNTVKYFLCIQTGDHIRCAMHLLYVHKTQIGRRDWGRRLLVKISEIRM